MRALARARVCVCVCMCVRVYVCMYVRICMGCIFTHIDIVVARSFCDNKFITVSSFSTMLTP